MATEPSPLNMLCKSADECIWRQVRSVKSVILEGGNTVVLLCWGCIPGLLLVPLAPLLSGKAWLCLAYARLFLEGVQMLQLLAQCKNTNIARTSSSHHYVFKHKMMQIVKGKQLEKLVQIRLGESGFHGDLCD